MSNNELSNSSAEIVEQIEELPIEERQVVMAHLEMTQSPLPDPVTLEKYNDLYPDAAKTIIDNGVAEGAHRRKMEEQMLTSKVKLDRLRYIFAFIVSLIGIGLSFALVFTNHPLGGTIFGGVGLATVLALFIPQNNSNDDSNNINENSTK